MACLKEIRKILFKIIVIILTLFLVLPLTLTGLILVLPIYLYRYILSKVFKFFCPDFSKILSTRSAIFSCDDLYNKPRCNLLVYLILGREIDTLDKEREFLMKNLVLLKNKNGELKRQEMQQYITRWMGYDFWEWDKHFDIKNHADEYKGPRKNDHYDELDIYDIGNELAMKPFKKNASPWELVIFRNCTTEEYREPFTALMVRIHHSLADGFSILKLTTELISSKGSLKPLSIKRPELSISQIIWKSIKFIFTAPFEIVESIISIYDRNEWHVSENKLTRSLFGAFHTPIKINYIKEIKNLHGTSFTSVILAGFCGGIRRFMLENNVKVPKNIHCLTPLPGFNHPEYKLRNFATICFTKLPLGTEDPVQRLCKIEQDLKRLRKSNIPLLIFYLQPFIGSLFPFLCRIFSKQILVTAVMSNFPGPEKEVTYKHNDIPICDMMFRGGLMHGNIGLGLSAISYNGILRLGAGLDDILVPEGVSMYTLIQHVADEFDILKALGSV